MALFYIMAYPQVVRCYTIGFSDFSLHPGKVYTSKGTTPAQQKRLFFLLNTSRTRIHDFWGNIQSQPAIVFCHSNEVYRKYGSSSGSPANYFGSPAGSFVIISPDGLSTDVISHEMCHAELTGRLGWLTMNTQIPQWFNEGLALMVDYRFPEPGRKPEYRYYQEKWAQLTYRSTFQLKLEDLQEAERFYKGDSYTLYLAYMRSGLELSRWMGIVQQKGLLKLVENIRAGQDFDISYKQIEQQAAPVDLEK